MLLPEERLLDALDDVVVVRLARLHQLRIHFAVACRHAIVLGALEHGELPGLLRDLGDRLHRSGAAADHRDPLGGEVDPFLREAAGVVPLALEPIQALELRHVGGGKRAHARDQVARGDALALVGVHRPPVSLLVELAACHPGAELDVALQVMARGDVFEVAQDLRLRGIALRPLPFLQQLLVEREAIDVGVGIAPGARVSVPVPGAADAVAGLVHAHSQPELVPQVLQHVHAGEPGTDHDRIKVASHSLLLLLW